MKKTIITLSLIVLSYMVIGVKAEELIEIPNESIRVRIIANSNSEYDQKMKQEIKTEVQMYMQNLLKDVTTKPQATQLIKQNLKKLSNKLDMFLHQLGYNEKYDINFGLNYFPEKEYKGIKYEEGYYESLLITLGEGKGNNWWCVLFPPLCLLEAEESDDIEYKSYVKEILEKYF